MVDLSIFGRDQLPLIRSLRSAHRSLRFQPVLQQMKAAIEGPFAAVRALRQDLIRRASQLKSTVSAQTAAVKLRETPLNPRVISHHKSVSSVSRSGSKAKLGPACTNCLSTPLQTTGEATEVQSLLSKTQNASTRQKVSSESLAVGSFGDEREQQSDRDRLERTEKGKAIPRQVLNAEVKSSLSGLDLLKAEEISVKQPGVDDISEKRIRPDRATKIRGDTHIDYLKESDQSSSAVTAEILQMRLKDVSTSSKSATEDLSAICSEDQEDTCIWVDSYTFRYIEKFDKKELDRCLRGHEASVECIEGTELTRILLTERRNFRTDPRIRWALEDLKGLVKFWLSMLRVQQIDFDDEEQKQRLVQICNDVSFLYNDVLYVMEDSCVKIIGRSVSSHLFYKRVEDRVAKVKDTESVIDGK